MSVHLEIEKKGIYFITFTCFNWLPLIDMSNGYTAVYRFFEALTDQGNAVLGYVIMPNHLHMLLYYDVNKTLNTVIGNGKRFMAYAIVKGLSDNNQYELLNRLKAETKTIDRARGKKHEIWKSGFDAKQCRTEKFVLQKLNYIHRNPINGKWKLCGTILDYLHSSARFYITGKQALFEVKDYRNFLDWEKMYD